MDPSSPEGATEHRRGVAAGLGAYSLWGTFPLVFHQLRSVGAGEILLHRIIWSFVVVVVVLRVGGDRGWLARVRATPGALPRLAVAAVLIATNWIVYIWAVNHERITEAALGYYINPLVSVALGTLVLGERLQRLQEVALGFGAASVVVLTVAYGRLPWISLVLAVSFGGYGYVKKQVPVGAAASLAVETLVLLVPAMAGMVVIQVSGDAAFGHGSTGRDALLLALGVVTSVPLLLFAAAATRIPLSLVGLLQYLTPTLQLVCGVVVLDEDLPPERLAGFVLVWIALALLALDALGRGRRTAAATAAAVAASGAS